MQCPKCGSECNDGAKFCRKCGSPLLAAGNVPSAGSRSAASNTPAPGNYVPGRPPMPPQAFTAPKPKEKSRIWLIVVIIVIAVALIGVGAYFLIDWLTGDNGSNPGGSTSVTTATVPAIAKESTPPITGETTQPTEAQTQAPTEAAVKVPNVVGMKSANAYDRISNAGLKYKAEFDYSDSTPEDYIISQSPSEDSEAKPGDTVTLKISRGSKPQTSSSSPSSKPNSSPSSSSPSSSIPDDETTDRYGLRASYRYLTQSDISWMSLEEVQFAINEIYAKNGFRFTKGESKAYFESMSWYNPDTTDMKVVVSRMNDYEYANIKLMGNYRDSLK